MQDQQHTGRPSLDFKSGEWEVLSKWLEGELLEAYRSMAKLDATNDFTQQFKGKAAFITKLLSFGKTPVRVPASEE